MPKLRLHTGFGCVLALACVATLGCGPHTLALDLPGWHLVWHDEFVGNAGAPPDGRNWGYDIGGGGWGNAEREYYTDSTANAALDGSGALVITATTAPANVLSCWYGDCTHTSARLLTKGKYDFTYGRIEARIQIPYGQGLWPAFWMLGGDIDSVAWPACGEIDVMENIGREPTTVHGTFHGPGYSGANGIGGIYTQTAPFSEAYHVYAVEWESDAVRWYVDGSLYLTRTVADLPAGAPWVFDHPFFIILNVAVGG